MKNFLYVFHGKHASWNQTSEAEWKELGEQHQAWLEKLKGHYQSGGKLASKPSRVLSGSSVRPHVTDGPFAETKEMLTGYYLVKAEDMKQAVELAKGCPWMKHDRLEILEIES